MVLPDVVALAERDAAAARVLRLVDLALAGDEHPVDWVLAYATWEVVRADASDRGIDPGPSDGGRERSSRISLRPRTAHSRLVYAPDTVH
jgi:hypothetical protein